MRTIIAGCVLAVFSLGLAVADEFLFSTTKIEMKDGKTVITGKKIAFGFGKIKVKDKDKDKDKEEVKEMTYTIDASVKVFKGKISFNKEDKKITAEAGDPIETGFKDEAFKDVSAEKPVNLYLTTEGDKVTKVYLMKGKGKGKPKDQ